MSRMTWGRAIADEREEAGDESPTVAIAPANLALDREFDNGYGGAEGMPFTLWTEERVYFPVVYDGAEWVASVPRNPCDEATDHVGGQ